MAYLENVPVPLGNSDSEMEEGEIVDDLDELSDISSEEEFLLRQRLQVLESYNNVLQRKEAKRYTFDLGYKPRREIFSDVSEISRFNLNTGSAHLVYKDIREQRCFRSHHHKQKKRKDIETHYDLGKTKDHKKRPHRKKVIVSESSDESDDEYRNKRRKLQNAVAVNKEKIDTSSLRARLNKMLCGEQNLEVHYEENENIDENKQEEMQLNPVIKDNSCLTNTHTSKYCDKQKPTEETINLLNEKCELIDLCTDDEVRDNHMNLTTTNTHFDVVNKSEEKDNVTNIGDSDEDLELLRQHALKTKASNIKNNEQDVINEVENNKLVLSDDEDSDTAELRMICLKSALLKKAIERKRKQKLKKKLSQSFSLQDDLMAELVELGDKAESDNNTDIESVDMDIGSDIDEKIKDSSNDTVKGNIEQNAKLKNSENGHKSEVNSNIPEEDELEEDEDLLRAKLLTSLSKNLPKLVDANIVKKFDDVKSVEPRFPSFNSKANIPEQKKIIINLGESDSEGEHEAAKNLTKMHMKLSEQSDFQHKLDIFLKSARMEVENTKLPDVVQQKSLPKSSERFVAKAVNHLPKSEQIEYRNLVKRMAELEKIKQARQSSLNLINEPSTPVKDTLKPRNVSTDTLKLVTVDNLEEQIALSRKNIAEESAKMLKLKEEAIKLTQKYKIVATELRNITTAITLNKKVQRFAQIKLSKIRAQHQRLLNSLTLSKHSKDNVLNYPNPKVAPATKLQKENDPSKEEFKHHIVVKSVKVSVVNDFKEEKIVMNPRLSVQIDVNSNKKTIKVPVASNNGKGDENDKKYESTQDVSGNNQNTLNSCSRNDNAIKHPTVTNMRETNGVTGSDSSINVKETEKKNINEYQSPLQALNYSTWAEDPNGVLCPFDIDGSCKDPDCKYLHPKISAQ